MEVGVISISHWGMFVVQQSLGLVPAGWRVKDLERALAERFRADGVIEIVRA